MSKFKKPQQRTLDSIEAGLSGFSYKPSGFAKQFREVCDSLIPDSIFDDLYSDRGRPALSPSILTRLLLLELRDGRSDEQIVEDLCCDVRVRYMCDFGFDHKPIHPTTLVYHRLRLLYGTIRRDEIAKIKEEGFKEKDSPLQDVFDALKQAAIKLGLLDPERAQLIDSTAILGRAAVMDTYTLIWTGIRDTLKQCVDSSAEGSTELIAKLRRQDYLLKDITKPKIDWENDAVRLELLRELVADAAQIAEAGLSLEDKELQGLLTQLSGLVAQDVVTGKSGLPEIKDGVTSGRQVSTVDTEMRHGRKSKSRKFNGYKGTITADPESELITGVHVMGGNEHDSLAVVPIIEQQVESKTTPTALIGDRAYAAEEPRHEAMALGVAVVTKSNSTSTQSEFGKSNFHIDVLSRTVTCPVGRIISITGKSVTFSGSGCRECPHREACLGKGGKRTIKIRDRETLQQDAERFSKTERGKALLSLRPTIERVIAFWVRNGVRQARYFGRPKVWLQAMLSAIMCNLSKIGTKAGIFASNYPKNALNIAYSTIMTALNTMFPAIAVDRLFVPVYDWYQNMRRSTSKRCLQSALCSVVS